MSGIDGPPLDRSTLIRGVCSLIPGSDGRRSISHGIWRDPDEDTRFRDSTARDAVDEDAPRPVEAATPTVCGREGFIHAGWEGQYKERRDPRSLSGERQRDHSGCCCPLSFRRHSKAYSFLFLFLRVHPLEAGLIYSRVAVPVQVPEVPEPFQGPLESGTRDATTGTGNASDKTDKAGPRRVQRVARH